jgi:alginate O-acetyltransferase complex protein AlgI
VLFNSLEYLAFFLLVLAASWLLVRRPRARVWVLLLASYYFYAANNHWLIVLILISTQIDYRVALAIEGTESPVARRRWMLVSVVGNLGMLGFFKYFNFFVDSFAAAGGAVGLESTWKGWAIVLPVGISFYTFQSMSYTLDVYRGQLPAERSWARFAFYVAYFPQLVAGPIMRASLFLPQIDRPSLSVDELEQGLVLIARGLVKKIVLADFLATFADAAFDQPETVSTFGAWLGLYAFTFQIYFDFSGYTDIAIGCSRLMGYHLPDNFNLPYIAVSFSDFWRRWHISLSTWLRDYLYVPMGGNRTETFYGVARNMMVTMLLGGLWHGAAWHFVLWGALHGIYLVIERWLGWRDITGLSPLRLMARRFLVFHAVVLTWLVFRAQDMDLLWGLVRAMGPSQVPLVVTWGTLAAVGVILGGGLSQLVCLRWELTRAFLALPLPLKAMAYAAAAVAVAVFNSEGAQTFIYFQF